MTPLFAAQHVVANKVLILYVIAATCKSVFCCRHNAVVHCSNNDVPASTTKNLAYDFAMLAWSLLTPCDFVILM